MRGGVPSSDIFGDEGPPIAMLGMQRNQQGLFLVRPLLLIDAAPQVVVIPLATLLPIARTNPELLLHYPGNLTPFANLAHLEKLLQNVIVLE